MIKNKLTTLISTRFLRYVIVGGISFIGDYATFLVFYYVLHSGTALAAPAGLVVGFVINFTLNKAWSFENKGHDTKLVLTQVGMYVTLVVINTIFTYFFVELLKNADLLAPKYSKLLASILIIAWNYIIYKKIIFRSEPRESLVD